MFVIQCVDDKVWNQFEFVEYLVGSQNGVVELAIVSEAIDLENLGVYRLLDLFKFKQVIVNTWNPLEKHDRYEIRFFGPTFWFDRLSDINPALHTWDQKKIFLCFYHRPNASRLALAGHLNRNYSDQSIIHFSTDINDDSLARFEFDKLLKYDISSLPAAADLLKSLPILQGSRDRHTQCNGYDYEDPLTSIYTQVLVDLVGETHVLGRTFFPTEKTTRPILLKKPFVVFASRDYLAYMRQMGFRTFQGFWDEDYDGFETKDRLLRIYQVIHDIASRTPAELADMYQRMQPILNHNYDLLMSQTYGKNIVEIV
jgi:hypothetical protein